jgi:F-type H+-transporting ATPase subunit epsilon
MKLKVLTPVEVVLDEPAGSVVAEGRDGSFGLKPRHADFVSALVPGLLYFERPSGEEGEYLALDRGVLVKHGHEVLVSVRNAVRGERIEELVRLVHTRFMALDEGERVVRAAMARLESDFLRRFLELK